MSKIDTLIEELQELDLDGDEVDFFDDINPDDAAFWQQFFKIEEVLGLMDPEDGPTFNITIQNEQTGEVKSYSGVRLKSGQKELAA